MSAPKLDKKVFKESPVKNTAGDLHTKEDDISSKNKSNISNIKDKQAIKLYQEKISKFVQDEKNAKKAALIIELLINNSKKSK